MAKVSGQAVPSELNNSYTRSLTHQTTLGSVRITPRKKRPYFSGMFSPSASTYQIAQRLLISRFSSVVKQQNSSSLIGHQGLGSKPKSWWLSEEDRNNMGIGYPNYDSGWTSISPDQTITLTHALGTQGLLINVMSRLEIEDMPHNIYDGGVQPDPPHRGIYWHNLTTSQISVTLAPDDDDTDQFRLRIWKIGSV